MKKFAIQSVLLLIVVAGGIFFYSGGFPNASLPFLPQAPSSRQVLINDAKIKVEIADTQDKRSKGLGGREAIASDEGMLFVFDRTDRYPFWMKNLSFALDFIWINGEKIVEVTENVPPPASGTPDSALTIFSSTTVVDKVLEVGAGTIKRLNIKVGDSAKLL